MIFSSKHIPTKYLFALGLFLAVAVVYFPVLSFDFVNYDDNIHVYANLYILDFSWEHFSQFWLKPYLKLYIPLTYSVWGVLAQFSALFSGGGPNPAIYHGVNFLLHGVNALLVFAILRRLFKVDRAAFFGALLFAMHPVQVEAVAWVSGLKDVLSGFFLLAALWLYILKLTGRKDVQQRGWLLFGGATTLYIAALLCKPNTVVLPLIAGIIGFVVRKQMKPVFYEIGVWLLLALPIVLITRTVQPQSVLAFQPALWQRLLVAGDALSFYAAHLVFPFGFGLDYGRTPEVVLNSWLVFLTGFAPYFLYSFLLWKYPKSWLTAACLIVAAALLPVLGLVPFQFQSISTVADRYFYVAMLGPALASGWVLARTANKAVRGAFYVFWVLCVIVQVSVLYHWQNSQTLNQHALRINPKSQDSLIRLGVVYSEKGRHMKAIDLFQQAADFQPESAQANYNLALEYAALKEAEKTVMFLKRAVALDPLFFEAYAKLGTVLYDLGWDDDAAVTLQKALALNPAYLEGALRLGVMYLAWGQNEEAAKFFEKALLLDKSSVRAHLGLAQAYDRLGKKKLALAVYRQVLLLQPDSAENWHEFGVLLEGQGQPLEAAAAYEQAIKIDQEYIEPRKKLAILRLQQKAYQEAVHLLQPVIDAGTDDPEVYMSVGLAKLEGGDAQQGLVWLEKAIAVAPAYAPARLYLARLYLRLGRHQQAIQQADKAEALGLHDQPLQDALVPFRRK